jgi:SagB-type dehydrogenase family enzyme
METNRRDFLRCTAASAAFLLSRQAWADSAPRADTALALHRATRNTRQGAIGTRLRALRDPLPTDKPYPGKPRIALPTPSWEAARPLFDVVRSYTPAKSFSPEPVSHSTLARLLLLTNGVTQGGAGPARRAAPSAGALYAGEVYAVVERVDGVAPGVYSYHSPSHQLVALREGSLLKEVASALEPPPDSTHAALAVLLTNVFERYTVRYSNRGYRYAWIDTGHIGENLRLAASELGLGDLSPLRFEDARLNTLLGIDGQEEAVCAVHLVGRPTTAPPAAKPDGGSADHGASSNASVSSAIRTRRSARHFDSGPMPRADLLRILDLAIGYPALRRTTGLDLYAVAHRVTDLAPGLYRYQPATGDLEPRRRENLADPLIRACLGQAKSGEAAAALIGVARLPDGSTPSDYRHLLLEAGATAQRIYLSAEALGLTARNLAAFYDDELDALLGLDSQQEVAVHLTAIGRGD